MSRVASGFNWRAWGINPQGAKAAPPKITPEDRRRLAARRKVEALQEREPPVCLGCGVRVFGGADLCDGCDD